MDTHQYPHNSSSGEYQNDSQLSSQQTKFPNILPFNANLSLQIPISKQGIQIQSHDQNEEQNNAANLKTNEPTNNQIQSNDTLKICINSAEPISLAAKTSPVIKGINCSKQTKVKISAQNLEKLTSQEKFDLALVALNQPANQRNLVEQKLIEDAIDSFQYIQKMKKRKPTLAKQVARVVEHQMCKKGQAVFYAGQQPEKFYLILRGKVAVLLKKTESQIAMDRKNGKYINLQNVLDRCNQINANNSNLNNSNFLQLEKIGSIDQNSPLNTPKSPMKIHSPSSFSQQKNNNSPNTYNRSSLLFPGTNQTELFGRKLSVQNIQTSSQQNQNANKTRQMSIFNYQFFNNDKDSNSSSSTEFNNAQPQDLISQFNKDNQGEVGTPTLISNYSRLSQARRQRNTINISKNISVRLENRPIEYVSKNIFLTPDELEEPEKFYENGVFRYEFAKDLEQGAAFGEMGLLLKVPRTATILAVEDTDFVVMNKQNYQNIIKSLENYKLEKKIQFFHQALHFDFKIDEFGKLCIDFSQKKQFIKEQHIFKEGEKAKEVLLIKSGEIELYKTITGPEGKKKKIQLSYIGPGEILGVEELFYQKDQRYYNARCLNEVKAYFINKYLFIRLMHEIPDLKSIMQKRAKNKLKWQEFKIQEMLESFKIEGQLEKTIPDFSIPSSQTQIVLEGKRTKRGSVEISESDLQSPNKYNENKQETYNHNNSIQAFSNEYQLLKPSRSDLMVPHARKHNRTEDIHLQSQSNNIGKVHQESLRGYERIEDQLRVKEQVLEMMEKNANNLNSQLNSKLLNNNDKKKNAHEEAIHNHVGHLICNENWFDMEKKKQLEQKIADAIKLRRQPLKSQRLNLQLKQKAVNLPPVNISSGSTSAQTQSASVTSLSSLPYDMQKKVIKFKKERDRSQFNEYINSLSDIACEELLSPMSSHSSTGQLSSLKALRKVGRASLSLCTNDKSQTQVFFPQSEYNLPQSEVQTPSPLPKKNGKHIFFGSANITQGKTIHSSLSQLVSLPQTQKAAALLGYYYNTKTHPSQSSFQDIAEEPYLESQTSQKNIDSSNYNQNKQQDNQDLKLKSKTFQKQSTLQELEDEYEKDDDNVKGQKSSLEALETEFDQNNNNNNKQKQMDFDKYYVKSNSQTKIKLNLPHSKSPNIQHHLNLPQKQQTRINSILYKSLNEIEQINMEESLKNSNTTQQQQQFQSQQNKNQDNNNNTNNNNTQNKQQLTISLNTVKSADHLFIGQGSYSNTSQQNQLSQVQGIFKGNRTIKKLVAEKQKHIHLNSLNNSQKLAGDKIIPEFIIKQHHIMKIDHKNQSQNKSTIINNNNDKSINNSNQIQTNNNNNNNKINNNNSRSQSFQIKLSHVN